MRRTTSGMPLLGCVSAVEDEHRAGHMAGLVRAEVADGCDKLLG
jgi:hypothetical protein